MNFKHAWIISDIHGSYVPIKNFINRNKDKELNPNDDLMIITGDAGTNYYLNKRDSKFKNKLSSFPFTYFIIRGNHEARASVCAAKDPDNWHREEFLCGGVWVENEFPQIKYAEDAVAAYKLNGYSVLSIPGAYSVDKYYRLKRGWSWFEDEQLTQDERLAGLDLIKRYDNKFDLVLSHTCPVYYEPTDLFLSAIDQSTVDKTMERYLSNIEINLQYKIWIWGHFHRYRVYPFYEGKQCIMMSNGLEVIDVLEWLEDNQHIHTCY